MILWSLYMFEGLITWQDFGDPSEPAPGACTADTDYMGAFHYRIFSHKSYSMGENAVIQWVTIWTLCIFTKCIVVIIRCLAIALQRNTPVSPSNLNCELRIFNEMCYRLCDRDTTREGHIPWGTGLRLSGSTLLHPWICWPCVQTLNA